MNIAKMKNQLLKCGIGFDWSREFSTHHPDYYIHTQRLFLLLLRHNLVVKHHSIVTYDPLDKTVLANEQVINGRAERSGAAVESRLLAQWSIKTTDLADRLYGDLDGLSKWPKHIIKAQRNWIGLVQGGYLKVCVCGDIVDLFLEDGVGFKGCENDIVLVSATNKHVIDSMDKYYTSAWKQSLKRLPTASRTFGFNTGLFAILDNVKIPILISPFLVHNASHYIYVSSNSQQPEWKRYHRDNTLTLFTPNPKQIDLMGTSRYTKGNWYALKDWVVSRQRKWGTPIPIINCGSSCGPVPVPEDELPLTHAQSERETNCPRCGTKSTYEKDTLDTFFDSSWYHLRFLDPHNPSSMCAVEKVQPVDMYIGGREHATMHLLYARFIWKALYDLGLVGKEKEPFIEFVDVGVVQAQSYQKNGKYVTPSQGQEEGIRGRLEKMSKSKLNGVDPVGLVERYGADVVRFHMLAKTKVGGDFEWKNDDMKGAVKFVEKVRGIVGRVGFHPDIIVPSGVVGGYGMEKVLVEHNAIVNLIQEDIRAVSLHTITSHLYKLVNLIQREIECGNGGDAVIKRCTVSLLCLSLPFITQTCRELMRR